MKPGFVNTIRNLNRSPCNGRKKEKGRRRNSRFKSRHRSLWRQFWDSEGTRGSRTQATWEVIARSAVLQDNASVHMARVSRQALKDTGSRKLTTQYSPDLAPSDYFLFPI
ncbi:hypothetical protein EVAR_78828_1 [Eumeta japonica]|uniref:Mariner Mos1 transposase n=1 Tax=Eumeta variegata TaxID=151549 RepID=A0A4C1ZFL8_EUMVA|nr:hypothetical protein EVAR_78828_1 [Eumeta japonica]